MREEIERYYSATSYVSGVVTITPDLAKEMLERNTHNRPISKPYVSKLAKEMSTSNWQLNGQSIKFTKEGILLDGQHRLKACIYSGVPFTTVISGGLDKETFKTTDCGRGRNLGQMIGTVEKKYYSTASAILRNYVQLVDGVKFFHAERTTAATSSMSGRSTREYYELYEKMKDSVNEYAAIANRLAARMKYFPISAGYTGAMIMFLVLNLRYEQNFVLDFFNQLYSYQTPKNATIMLLWKKMLDIMGDRNANHIYTAKYKVSLLHKTWNLYAIGKQVKQLNVGSNDVELLSSYEARKLL